MKLLEHPTVLRLREAEPLPTPKTLSAEALKAQLRALGADDVGFVELEREAIADQKQDILKALPSTQTLISFVCRMNRGPIRTPERSVANVEFHDVGHDVNALGHKVVRALEAQGFEALNPAMGFPMEMDRFPDKIWVVSHKPVAAAAGLGQMGLHRNLIHPQYGSFVLLGTILTDARVDAYDAPIDYDPCVDCKLCVAACPVGAISPDGAFNFGSCYTHNYREFMGGFDDFVLTLAQAKNKEAYNARFSDAETASMWQSLSFGANYKAAYCLAVCPAGEDVLRPFLDDRGGFLKRIVKPLTQKEENVYVLEGSDAKAHVEKRFPHKTPRIVQSNLRPTSAEGFLRGLSYIFQSTAAEGFKGRFRFTFSGSETCKATVTIDDGALEVVHEHLKSADLDIFADAETWIRFLRKETGILWPVLTRKIRFKGKIALMRKFEACFPV